MILYCSPSILKPKSRAGSINQKQLSQQSRARLSTGTLKPVWKSGVATLWKPLTSTAKPLKTKPRYSINSWASFERWRGV